MKSVPPKIWSQFSAIRKNDGTVFKFRIQDGTVDEKEELINFILKYFYPSEATCKAAGVSKSEEAMKELLKRVNVLLQNVENVMVCYEDKNNNTPRNLIGVSIITLETPSDNKLPDPFLKVKTPEMKKLKNILACITQEFEAILTMDKYYEIKEVCVHPDYQGLGIAREFLRLGKVLCKENGVEACTSILTSIGTQKAVDRDGGWTTLAEIPFTELGRRCECQFVDAPPTCKLVVTYVEK